MVYTAAKLAMFETQRKVRNSKNTPSYSNNYVYFAIKHKYYPFNGLSIFLKIPRKLCTLKHCKSDFEACNFQKNLPGFPTQFLFNQHLL